MHSRPVERFLQADKSNRRSLRTLICTTGVHPWRHKKGPGKSRGLSAFNVRPPTSFDNDLANRLAARDHRQNMFLVGADHVQQVRLFAA